jgi:hypothetical protein
LYLQICNSSEHVRMLWTIRFVLFLIISFIYIYIYIYVWKLNQTVLELDFRAVNFFFFPRRDLNPHHCYTAAPFAKPYVQRPRPLDYIHFEIQWDRYIVWLSLASRRLYIYIYIYIHTHTHTGGLGQIFGIFFMGLGDIFIWAKKTFRPKFQSHLITIYVCLIAYRKRLEVEGIVI